MCEVSLVLRDNVAYVWNYDDWKKIREFRIVGKHIGGLAALPKQTVFHGFPLALLPEETTLLLEKKFAKLVEYLKLAETPNVLVQEISRESKEYSLKGQIEILKDERKKEIVSKIDQIYEGKKKKLMSTGKVDEALQITKEEIFENEISKIEDPNVNFLGTQVHIIDPWLVEEELKHPKWNYPVTDTDKILYATFKDLWEKRFYLTGGGKFGGNFLAYPGDPLLYHAQFIVICTTQDTALQVKQLIAYGRLANSVRKTIVLSYFTDNMTVAYQSVQWSGH